MGESLVSDCVSIVENRRVTRYKCMREVSDFLKDDKRE